MDFYLKQLIILYIILVITYNESDDYDFYCVPGSTEC